MALQTDRAELLSAWRALGTNPDTKSGWRTIPLSIVSPQALRAARHFPGNEEALLIAFSGLQIPSALQLPQGRGFALLEVDLGFDSINKKWLALCRRTEGGLDLFSMMVLDLISSLRVIATEAGLFEIFLARIRAWQNFMHRGVDTHLNLAAEVGLYGELLFLRQLLAAGISSAIVIDSWLGPVGGAQDFALGPGAVEVKTSIAAKGFLAEIASLEQLDHATRQPLFLVAERVELNEAGTTLPLMINEIRDVIAADPLNSTEFATKLIHAGYLEATADQYSHSFLPISRRLYLVDDAFPKLTRTTVPLPIRKARYEIDIDAVPVKPVELSSALRQLGVF